jgi:hypothetical protein
MDRPTTSWAPIALVAIATAVLANVLGVGTLAAILLGSAVLTVSAVSALAPQVRWGLVAWRIRTELRDPTGPLLGAIVGAAVLAAGIGLPWALAAALAVMSLKIASVLLLPARSDPRPKLAAGSAAETWLSRAERAVFAMRRIQPARESGLAERFAETRAGAEETLVLIRRLAVHETAVSGLLTGIDEPRVRDEHTRLEAEQATASSVEMREEIGRALVGLRDQQAARGRLSSTDQTLIARMRTAAIGLEGLVARLSEIAVLAHGGAEATAHARVAELADELDALRAGLTEADSLGKAATYDLRPSDQQTEVRK